MRNLFCIICLLISAFLYSQNQANIWYFGKNAGLDFNSGVPVALTDGELDTKEGCATICDGLGNLLFYTDGQSVWDRTHAYMSNGLGLLGHDSSSQSAIIVPNPADQNIYYIFTVDHQGNTRGLNYSIVDLSLNAGLGAITTKNVQLATPVTEKITAVRHGTDDAYWVISHRYDSNEFLAYYVDGSGVNTNPVTTAIGSVIENNVDAAIGYLKVSPDGSKIASANHDGVKNFELFDYDNSTGILSNLITLSFNFTGDGPYGVEFSPDSNILYLSSEYGDIYQFQLNGTPTQVLNSRFNLTRLNTSQIAALQLGPDLKLYVAVDQSNNLAVINNPNIYGNGADFSFNGPDLNGRRSRLGLPPFIQSFFTTSIETNNVCVNEPAEFRLSEENNVINVIWDFGDGNTSTVLQPTHTYTTAGIYTVTASVTTSLGTENFMTEIEIYEAPPVLNLPNSTLCDTNNDGIERIDYNDLLQSITSGFNDTRISFNVYLNQTDAENETNPITQDFDINDQDQVFIRSYYPLGSCFAISSFSYILTTQPIAHTIPQVEFCNASTFLLSSLNNDILNNQDPNLFTVTYHTTLNDAQNAINPLPDSYNSPVNNTLFVRVTSRNNTDCFAINSFQIFAGTAPIANPVLDIEQCGEYIFDSLEFNNQVLENQSNTVFDVLYFLNLNDAISDLNPIADGTLIDSNQIIVSKIFNINNPSCYDTNSFNISITPFPEANAIEEFFVCDNIDVNLYQFNDTIIGDQDPSLLEISYFMTSQDAHLYTNTLPQFLQLNQESTTLIVRVHAISNPNCYTLNEVKLTKGITSIPIIATIDKTDWSPDRNTITIEMSTPGEYLYALDNGPFQNSNTFTNLRPGVYKVTIKYEAGCETISEEVVLMHYPKYFTPNSDGYHDLWQITGAYLEPQMQIFIFDRFGKLLKQLDPLSAGWDGNYNGQAMPSDDYWFKVIRENEQIYKGHFSLIRR